MGLADRVEHRPGELSGGQQQRVAVARALVGDPALLLADEPTGNLDSTAAVDVLRLFDELHRQGRTVVLITHEAEVAQHAARVIRIRDGAIAADDSGGVRMTWSDLLRNGWDAIRAHKLRSTLTALGILIGIAAVVLTVGLGQGAQQKVSKQLAALGGNLLIVSPGSSTSGGVRGGFGSASTLTMADATALTSKTAAPDVERRGTGVAERQPVAGQRLDELDDDGRRHDAVVAFGARAAPCQSGRFLTAAEESSAAAVTVLASDTATELFGPFDPVGQTRDHQQRPVRGGRSAHLGRLGLDQPTSTIRRSCRSARRRSASSAARTARRCRRSTSRPRRRTGCRPPTRRRTRSCSTDTRSPRRRPRTSRSRPSSR